MQGHRFVGVAGLATAVIGLGAPAGAQAYTPGCAQSGTTTTCTYLAGDNEFVVPAGVTSMSVQAVGGAGGAGTTIFGGGSGGAGGAGASVTGAIQVTPGETLWAEVGSAGSTDFINTTDGEDVPGPVGGANGGGAGGGQVGDTNFDYVYPGGSGGGASDLSLGQSDIGDRLIVAGGGGGGGGSAAQGTQYLSGAAGGAAGAAGGDSGSGDDEDDGGPAGTALGPGYPSYGVTDTAAGEEGNGGGGGGGAGLYGGAGGNGCACETLAIPGSGGGGGSSLVPTGGTLALDTTGVPRVVISYTVPAADGPPTADFLPLGSVNGGAPYSLSFNGSGSYDPEFGSATGRSGLSSWKVKWGDGSASTTGTGNVGSMSHTYANPGTYLSTLTVVNTMDTATDSSSVIVTVSKAPSGLVAGAGTEQVSGTSLKLALSATLTRTDTNTPLAGKTVFFGADNALVCIGTTSSSGVASCTGTLPATDLASVLANGFVATFVGDQDTLGSSASGKVSAGAVALSQSSAQAAVRGLGRTVRGSNLRALHGSATSSTRLVRVSIDPARSWVPARFLTASGTTRWSVHLTHRLKAGRYRVYVAATDARGRVRFTTETFTVTR